MIFNNAFGELKLTIYPETSDPNLQAWDSADRYLLDYLNELDLDLSKLSVLVCNDEHGAISVAVNESSPYVWNDNALAHCSIQKNYELNELPITFNAIPSTNKPVIENPYDLVLLKIPKALSYLEDQLAQLSGLITPDTIFISAGKVKHIHTSTLELFEQYIGETKTSLAKQKSRLIFSRPNEVEVKSPWPQAFEYGSKKVLGHSNVFSHRRLDIGTRFLCDEMKKHVWVQAAKTVVDLGCGNGLVGLQALSINPDLECIFTDRSYMAIESAKANVKNWFGELEPHQFYTSDVLQSVDGVNAILEPGSVDLVLCNPPFHDNHNLGTETSAKMFEQSAEVLSSSGIFVLVANRHLKYRTILNKYFSNVNIAASNSKFVITISSN